MQSGSDKPVNNAKWHRKTRNLSKLAQINQLAKQTDSNKPVNNAKWPR